MSRWIRSLCVATVCLGTGLGSALAANPTLNTQLFRPSAHPGDLLTVLRSDGHEQFQWNAGLSLTYGNNPLVFVNTANGINDRHEVIQDQMTLDLLTSFAPADWVDVGLALPLFLMNEGQAQGFAADALDIGLINSFAVGDLRLSGKFSILRRGEDELGFGLGFETLFVLPTGDTDSFASDGFAFQPSVIADYKIKPMTIAVNLGARIRGPAEEFFLDVGHEFFYRMGVEVSIVDDLLSGIGELYGATNFSGANETNMEGVLAARLKFDDPGIHVTLGGGSGFTKGYGNTKYRLFLMTGISPPVVRDTDEDGLYDDVDKCPLKPEDKDNFEDQDGCPDLDNDKDEVEDAVDRCPNDPEDLDAFEDTDGCPDPDNDGDGIPDEPDRCPNRAEDKDNFQDKDGCPDLDNDRDRIPDASDRCPLQPEVYNGFEDEDGCPDETKAKVVGKKIVITDKIYFNYNKDTIKEESYSVVDAVAGVLKANPQIKSVRIEGHTDDRGGAKRNKRLSQARADAVRAYLIQAGIDGARMSATGFGEDRPAMPGRSASARTANRRVEFIIDDQ